MAAGKELKRLRGLTNYSAKDVAAWIGVTESRYTKWEQRGNDPNGEDKIKVESYFKTPLEDLDKLEKFDFYALEHSPPTHSKSTVKLDTDKINPLTVINKLIDQNETLVKSNAEAISNTSRLVGITEKLTNRFVDITGNDGPKIPVTFDSKTIDLLVSISDFVVGKRFESSEEFLTLVNKRFHVVPQDTFLADTRKD